MRKLEERLLAYLIDDYGIVEVIKALIDTDPSFRPLSAHQTATLLRCCDELAADEGEAEEG